MGLSADQIGRLSHLLDEALAMREGERESWLQALTAADASLVVPLRAALRHRDADQIGTLPAIGTVTAGHAPPVGAPGLRVGPYELLRELGVGGMAVVWLARRADGAYQRQVALKLPRLSHTRPDAAQRFARERDILAGLEHAGIARLYDAGVTEAGLPYIAMEHVEGSTLNRWCDEHALSLRERLQLFLQVLAAVQYAHARRVVHRDLKPGNIMVSGEGEVRLLDFGIAKLLEDAAQVGEGGDAVEEAHALTPGYASPEQKRGQAIGPASDLYSLGLVLRELVAGPPLAPPVQDERLTRLVASCLSEEPALRPSSAQAMARVLREIAYGAEPATFTGAGTGAPDAGTASLVLAADRDDLIGRDDDLAGLLRALADGQRLLTLVGAGGIGKTRVAREVAKRCHNRLPDGVWWVDLTPLADADLLPGAVAAALQLPAEAGDPLAAVVATVARWQALLVLDNCEHVAAAAARCVERLLAAAPTLAVLATSQVPLHLAGERVLRLEPLSVPAPGDSLATAGRTGAIRLLQMRAQALDRRFAFSDQTIAGAIDICRRLDGLPLALEMAAARLPVIGVEGVASRLQRRFEHLRQHGPGAPSRQQTLRAALDWSFGLLPQAEQRVLHRLSVFAGSFDLVSAQAVGCKSDDDEAAFIDRLGVLIDNSLVATLLVEPPRYQLLDSVRLFAAERLATTGAADDDEPAAVHRRFVGAMLASSERALAEFWQHGRSAAWMRARAADIDNLRAAVHWSIEHAPDQAAALLGAAGRLFGALSLSQEYRALCERLDHRLDDAEPCAALARYWLERSRMMLDTPTGAAPGVALHAVDLQRRFGDDVGLYSALAYAGIGCELTVEHSERLMDELRRIERADWPLRLRHFGTLAEVVTLQRQGRFGEACQPLRRELALARAEEDHALVATDLNGLADALLGAGDTTAAERAAREALALDTAHRGPNRIHTLSTLLAIRVAAGQAPEARAVLAEFLLESRAQGWDLLVRSAGTCAALALLEGRAADAARLLGFAGDAPARGAQKYPNEARQAERARAGVDAHFEPAVTKHLMLLGAALDLAGAAQVALRVAGHEHDTAGPEELVHGQRN